jgi:hypothetical protein
LGAGLAGFAAAFGFAGFASGFSAASGLAFACLADFGSDFAADLASLPASLVSDFALFLGSAAVSGFFAATRDFLPRCRAACSAASVATAAIKAAPVLVGPV